MSDLYDADIVEWSNRQAQLLRGVADGRPGNEQPDWDNIIEELEDVGRSQIQAVESLLMRALLHDLKVLAWPHSLNVPHWQAEAKVFRRDARRRLTPSMRQRINVVELFNDAHHGLPETQDGYPPFKDAPLLARLACPSSLDKALEDPSSPDAGTTA